MDSKTPIPEDCARLTLVYTLLVSRSRTNSDDRVFSAAGPRVSNGKLQSAVGPRQPDLSCMQPFQTVAEDFISAGELQRRVNQFNCSLEMFLLTYLLDDGDGGFDEVVIVYFSGGWLDPGADWRISVLQHRSPAVRQQCTSAWQPLQYSVIANRHRWSAVHLLRRWNSPEHCQLPRLLRRLRWQCLLHGFCEQYSLLLEISCRKIEASFIPSTIMSKNDLRNDLRL